MEQFISSSVSVSGNDVPASSVLRGSGGKLADTAKCHYRYLFKYFVFTCKERCVNDVSCLCLPVRWAWRLCVRLEVKVFVVYRNNFEYIGKLISVIIKVCCLIFMLLFTVHTLQSVFDHNKQLPDT